MKCGKHGELAKDETSEYIAKRNGKTVLKQRCKQCHRDEVGRYKKRNRTAYNAWSKEDRRKNPEKYSIYEKTNRLKNKELFGYRSNQLQILAKYKLSSDEYGNLFESHNHLCAICGQSETRKSRTEGEICKLAIDHCHICEENGHKGMPMIRGLLCHGCNVALGLFKDDADRLQSAIDYLKRHNHVE